MAGSRYLAPFPVAVIRRNAVLLLHYHFVRYPAIRRKASAGQLRSYENVPVSSRSRRHMSAIHRHKITAVTNDISKVGRPDASK